MRIDSLLLDTSVRLARMAEEPRDFVLEYLRRIDAKLDRTLQIVMDLRERVAALETEVAALKTETAALRVAIVRVDHRIDAIDTRLQRIETRLDLINA
jgi:septal ring factor EnvC (AmiA/AmiB activator)